jgi:hypothetical protein
MLLLAMVAKSHTRLLLLVESGLMPSNFCSRHVGERPRVPNTKPVNYDGFECWAILIYEPSSSTGDELRSDVLSAHDLAFPGCMSDGR